MSDSKKSLNHDIDIMNVANDVVIKARKRGCSADAVVSERRVTEVACRTGKIEDIRRVQGRVLGLRVVMSGGKQACVSTSNFTNLDVLIDKAVVMAENSPRDRFISFAKSGEYGDSLVRSSEELGIFSPDAVSSDRLVSMALEMEVASVMYDSCISNTESVEASYAVVNTALVTDGAFINSYSRSDIGLSIVVVAQRSDTMENGYSSFCAHSLSLLPSPRVIGREAAEMAVAKLGSRKVGTCRVPVVFSNRVSGTLLYCLAAAVNGNNVVAGASFLAKSMNQRLFCRGVEIIDDPLLRNGIDSRPFDGEGLIGTPVSVVKDGELNSWILDLRSGNQLGLQTTRSAVRSNSAAVRPGISNFYCNKGTVSFSSMIGSIEEGLYVNELFGHGANLITGDYSQGVSGFWIENGQLSYPVNEITIAGNLRDMFASAVFADDLEFRGSQTTAPSVRIDGMTVAGLVT